MNLSSPKFAFAALAMLTTSGFVSAEEHGGGKSAIDLFMSTGWVGWLLVAVSMLGTFLALQNFNTITRDKLAPPQVIEELETLIADEN